MPYVIFGWPHNAPHSQLLKTGTDSSLPCFPMYFRRQIKRSPRLRCRVLRQGPAQLPNMQFVPILCPLPQGCNTFPDFKCKSLLPLQPEPKHALPGIRLARKPASTSMLEVSQVQHQHRITSAIAHNIPSSPLCICLVHTPVKTITRVNWWYLAGCSPCPFLPVGQAFHVADSFFTLDPWISC